MRKIVSLPSPHFQVYFPVSYGVSVPGFHFVLYNVIHPVPRASRPSAIPSCPFPASDKEAHFRLTDIRIPNHLPRFPRLILCRSDDGRSVPPYSPSVTIDHSAFFAATSHTEFICSEPSAAAAEHYRCRHFCQAPSSYPPSTGFR